MRIPHYASLLCTPVHLNLSLEPGPLINPVQCTLVSHSPLLLQSKLQHLDPSNQVVHQVLVTFSLPLKESYFCLCGHAWDGENIDQLTA